MTELLSSFAQFHFLRPWWLLALAPLAALIVAVRHRHQRGGAWQQAIHPSLLPLLVSGSDGRRAWPAGVMVAAAAVASVALAGPAWERTSVASSRVDSGLVILFDLSPSMLAADVRPDRLTRARLKTIDILKRHREGSVALVAWAGDAHVVTPLTDDANTLLSLLPVLHPDLMPRAGSNPELALEKGLELLMNAGHLTGDLLFVTDGFVEQAVENLQQVLRGFPEFRLSILGVGSAEGAPIPLGDGGFARDSRGDIVVAQLSATLLQRLAERNGGRYSTLTADDRDIDHLLAPIADQASGRVSDQERTLDTWHDRGHWLVLVLLPLGVLAFRRNLLALLLVAPLLGVPGSARAAEADSPWSTLWHNRDRQAHQALQNHQPERAANLFRDPRWRAVADYRRGDFAAAAEGFAGDHSAVGRFNLGNALARQGQLEDALAAYDQALAIDPDFADATFNRQLVEKLLAEQQENPPGENGETGEQNGEERGEPQPQNDNDAGQGERDSGEGEPEHGDSDSSSPDAASGEPDREDSESREPADAAPDDNQPGPDTQEAQAGADPDGEREAGPEGMSEAPPPPDSPASDPATAEHSPGEDSSSKQSGDHTAESGATISEENATEDSDPELDYWLRQVTDDPGGLLRRKFEYQSRQQALEPRQRFELPPDRFQEERW